MGQGRARYLSVEDIELIDEKVWQKVFLKK